MEGLMVSFQYFVLILSLLYTGILISIVYKENI